MHAQRYTVVYSVLGSIFLGIGIYTLFNVAVAWHIAGVVLWRAVAYAAVDILVAQGFFYKERWLLPFFGVATVATLLLAFTQGVRPTSFVGVGINLVFLGFVFATRRDLQDHGAARLLLGVVASGILLGTVWYNMGIV